ncbi:MAG: DMT family transporter [Lachnospiraceae bacterium]|nr:DMT family transporter [Lachnospiraceae bacterium]
MKKQAISAAELLLTAFIWGVAFVAQSVGMDYIGPFTFNCVRCIIGGIVLIPLIIVLRKTDKTNRDEEEIKAYKKNSLIGGICCGICLCTASCFQQFGIMYTTVGKAGFITALYIIIVPILGIFIGKKVAPIVWVSSVIAVIGFYLLSISGQVSINKGDILVLICAVLFSFHILVIDYFSPKGEGVTISCIQFLTSGIICGILMFIFENPQITDILAAYLPILYAGIMSCGVAYTLQIIGQKNMDPTIASLILSLESVFSALAGWMILGQGLSAKELLGCGLVFVAVLLAQMPQKKTAN